MKHINAGKYDKKITIFSFMLEEDADGARDPMNGIRQLVLRTNANVKTFSGATLIRNNTDFEKALTNFTIRRPRNTTITRDMKIDYNGIVYDIEYLNDVDNEGVELEIQAREVRK